jgi:hypothetical protein
LRGQQPMKTRLGRSVRFVEALVASIILSISAHGQTAKQGDASADPTVFQSPMILEAVFAPADRSLWVSDEWTPSKPRPWKRGDFTTIEYYNLGKFSCDGLYLRRDGDNSGLVIEKVNPVGANTEVKLEAYVTNPGGVHDKMVTLRLEILNANDVVAAGSTTIKVNCNWCGHRNSEGKHLKLLVPSSKLAGSRLRITMTTQDMATQD